MKCKQYWTLHLVCVLSARSERLNPGSHFTRGSWAHYWNLLKIIMLWLWFWCSNQVTNLHMSRQLSCRDMCKFMTWWDDILNKSNVNFLQHMDYELIKALWNESLQWASTADCIKRGKLLRLKQSCAGVQWLVWRVLSMARGSWSQGLGEGRGVPFVQRRVSHHPSVDSGNTPCAGANRHTHLMEQPLTHRGCTEWLTFCRQHFQMHFLWVKMIKLQMKFLWNRLPRGSVSLRVLRWDIHDILSINC